ncbi:MAG: PqqD family protein [Clostridiales bacterium]|nr:PqqD family protein [Clostridiales bacterium]
MKIKSGYVLREVAGNIVVVPIGEATLNLNGMITLNETSKMLWKLLEDGADEDSLTAAVLSEYDVDEQTARADVQAFIEKLRERKIVE